MNGGYTTALEAEQLSVNIGGMAVCSDLSLQIPTHSCWGILGPNGIGKTTLLHTFAGLHTVGKGRVSCLGMDVHSSARKHLARSMGVLFQTDDRGFPGNVLDTVLSGRHPHLGYWGWETADDLKIAAEALEQVGLQGMEKRSLASLSGGERRRLEIATLLAQQPRVALLDEPTNHLDTGQQIAVLDMLQQRFATADHAMILVLHDINHALRYCDHLLLLQGDGQWVAGPTAEVATASTLSGLYGYPLVQLEGPAGPVMVPA